MKHKLLICLIVIIQLSLSLACTDDVEIVDGGISTTGDQMIYEAAPTPTPHP